jgi:hypothetical protein
MSKESLRNTEGEANKDQERDEFKIELKKMGNLEQDTAQPPYDMVDGTAIE